MTTKNKGSLVDFVNPSRNYLTLIVVLIGLVCLAVGLTFAFSSQNLDSTQRWFFIIFLISFPIIGLTMSVWLILRHFRKLSVSESDDEIGWRIMSPENQQRKLNLEVNELASIMGIPETQMSDLRSAYIVAEDLAMRHIEREEKVSLMRHIALDNIEFDAILINQDVIKCLEVAFLVTPNMSQEKINTALRKVEITKKKLAKIRPNTKLIVMFVLVTQLDKEAEARLRSILSDKFSATPVDVDIRLLDFEGLQKVFAAE